jgi:hypothetical protein
MAHAAHGVSDGVQRSASRRTASCYAQTSARGNTPAVFESFGPEAGCDQPVVKSGCYTRRRHDRRSCATNRRSPRRPREVGARPTRSRHCKRGARLTGPWSIVPGPWYPVTGLRPGKTRDAALIRESGNLVAQGRFFRRARRRKEHRLAAGDRQFLFISTARKRSGQGSGSSQTLRTARRTTRRWIPGADRRIARRRPR